MRQPWLTWLEHHLAIAAFVALTAVAYWAGSPADGPVPAPLPHETPRETPQRTAPAGALGAVDQALTRQDVGTAVRAWRDAYHTALRTPGWEGLVDVGDAWLRIGAIAGSPDAPSAKAREVYLTALSRARRQGSLEGVLRVAEVFSALGGDDDLVRQCVRIAGLIAAQDPEARADMRAFATRFADSTPR